MQFDTEIKSVEKKIKKARKTFKVTGRGGTDFQAIMDYAEKSGADGLVISTDGYAPAPRQPRCKVLWLMNKKEEKPPCNFGYVAFLDRYESH